MLARQIRAANDASSLKPTPSRATKTPGKTQQFNYFNVNGESTFNEPKGEFNLVDLPGVGYAKVPKRVRDEWAKFMTNYFYTRPTLKVRTLCLSLSLKSLLRRLILVEIRSPLEMPPSLQQVWRCHGGPSARINPHTN